jgi:hypothetical protein
VHADLPTYGLWREGVAIIWYQSSERLFSFCRRERREFIMPPRRRDMKTPDPPEDREMARRRGR